MTWANSISEVSELLLTRVSKFRVSFGDPVDLERNFATMELTQSLRFGLMEINRT